MQRTTPTMIVARFIELERPGFCNCSPVGQTVLTALTLCHLGAGNVVNPDDITAEYDALIVMLWIDDIDLDLFTVLSDAGNVVNPDDITAEYGADALRLYEMFMGPLEVRVSISHLYTVQHTM